LFVSAFLVKEHQTMAAREGTKISRMKAQRSVLPDTEHAAKMSLFSSFNLASFSALCAALVACANTTEPASTVVRTRAPQRYEETITSYFAFKIRGPKNNVEISVDKPEPSECPLDGYITSTRGWVVPVVYATRTGTVTGKETIYISAKQYYFWFLGDTIAGITPRIELCPGPGSSLSEVAQPIAAVEGWLTAASPLPTTHKAQRREGVGMPEQSKRGRAQDRAMAAGGQRHDTTHEAKKTGTSSGAVRHAIKKVGNSRKKVGDSRQKVEAELKKQRLGAV
jgi:hypothetical protein